MTVCVVERSAQRCLSGLLREARGGLKMRYCLIDPAGLDVSQGEIHFDPHIARLDLRCNFKLVGAIERSARFHQNGTQGFVAFGDVRL